MKHHNSTTRKFTDSFTRSHLLKVHLSDTEVFTKWTFVKKKIPRLKWTYQRLFYKISVRRKYIRVSIVFTGYWHTMVCSFLISETKDNYCEYHYIFIWLFSAAKIINISLINAKLTGWIFYAEILDFLGFSSYVISKKNLLLL